MKVGDSVRKTIEDWELGDTESAMLHACNAVDGTAAKTYPNEKSNKRRFTRVIRENYAIFGPMAAPGINLADTRFPVRLQNATTADGKPDIADVIYGIHRCTHGHGDELPEGFDLLPDVAGPPGHTHIGVQQGQVRLSDRTIFALLAIAVGAPENLDQSVPSEMYLSFDTLKLPINEWWGRRDDLQAVVCSVEMPHVTLDFGDWMDNL